MNLGTAAWSSIGRKIINALTGLFFVGFVIGHLTGNLLLLVGPEAFNSYANFLTTLGHGVAIPLVEVVMIIFLAMHAASGITVWMNKSRARSSRYTVSGNAGGKSRKSAASQSMLYTGLLLLVFIVFHVAQFKFGLLDPRPASDWAVVHDGIKITNLYGRVIAAFEQPVWAFGYIFIMLMLGTHLWHGTWSAFQSLGLANDRYLPMLRNAGRALAALLAFGFLALPGIIHLRNGHYRQLDEEYRQAHSGEQATEVAPTASVRGE